MNNLAFLKSPYDVQVEIAKRMVARRKSFRWTQMELSARSGVTLASLRRFERTGEISLSSLVKLAFVLDAVADLENLFHKPEYKDIQEVINENRS